MTTSIVRIQYIELRNFKNVGYGKIEFPNNQSIQNKAHLTKRDLTAIYGPNGSGKTACIEAIELLKILLSGNSISRTIYPQINDNTMITAAFYMEGIDKQLVTYSVELKQSEEDMIQVIRENYKVENYENGIWQTCEESIEIDFSDDEKLLPKLIFEELVYQDEQRYRELMVAKKLAYKMRTSFIFTVDWEQYYTGDAKTIGILEPIAKLQNFAKQQLYVVNKNNIGRLSLKELLPHYVSTKYDITTINISLYETFFVPEEIYLNIIEALKCISSVLETIVPGTMLHVRKSGNQSPHDVDVIALQIELCRDNRKIPLKYETYGMKHIIGVINKLILVYNDPRVCIAIDELDAAIFELEFGNLIEILSKRIKGQLIFTANNLIALERLKNENIVVTSTNRSNCYVRLKKVEGVMNLRDAYLRSLVIGGQEEVLYEASDSYEMDYAFRKVYRANE